MDSCAHPDACWPDVAATVITVVPAGFGIVAWKVPWASATVCTPDVVFPAEPGWLAAMSTVAPGVVVPVTAVWPR